MGNELKTLLQPIEVGPLWLKNRMVRSPIWSRMASVDGEVTQQILDMYANSAKGGVAMVIVEAMAVDGRHVWEHPQLRIDDVKFMPGLRRLVQTIHLGGALCEFQLHCSGAFGTDPISPSGVPSYGLARTSYVQPRVLSLSEIEEIRDLFIAAAARAKVLECEGVLIHGGTSYLLQQFISPHTNKRTDRFGGNFENRIQLPLEIVRGIRKECGPSFEIGCSMVADELQPDGITVEESIAFAKALEREGVNHIDLQVGTYETGSSEGGRGASYRHAKGTFDYAEVFKKEVDIKIFVRCYGQYDPLEWEEALKKGQGDVIQIGKALLCDSELPNKVTEGRLDDIRLCIRCGMCTETGVIKDYQVSCTLNAELGRERDYAIKRITSKPKRVLVVGGGPGGLEAARVAALRGHDVTLMEKEAELGGNVVIASLPIGKEELKTRFIAWLERQCNNAGVKVELNKEVTPSVIEELRPDVVIIATGATPFIPPIPGIDKPHVFTAADVLTGKAHVQGKAVVLGGGEVGVLTADFIAEKGLAKSVIILATSPQIATDMDSRGRHYMLRFVLPRWGIRTFPNMQVCEITKEGVVVMDKEWMSHKFEADTVVNAKGYVPNTTLYEALKGKVPNIYRIGDCVKAGTIFEAVHEAAYIARQI